MLNYIDQRCRWCHSKALVYHQYLADARCEVCGEWQGDDHA